MPLDDKLRIFDSESKGWRAIEDKNDLENVIEAYYEFWTEKLMCIRCLDVSSTFFDTYDKKLIKL
ncbi:MAG: hypothetical protein KGD63_11245 [Candidatus Lokiarchaeota archaeon]|nr:hypothetical protein [Candidatus Lokiarchaeota archaeon]